MPEQNSYKKFIFFLAGNLTLVFGIMLILVWWPDVVSFFRGIAGMVFALAGILILYMVSQQK